MLRLIATLVVFVSLVPTPAVAQFGPVAEMDGVEVQKMADIPTGSFGVNRHPIRIAQDPTDGALYVLATSQPDGRDPGSTNRIYRLDPAADGMFDLVTVLEDDDHGTPRPVGMTFGPEGNLYLVGNDEVGEEQTQIVIRRGTPNGDGWDWATVATSEPYLFSYTYFDHRANSIVVTPDGSTLIVNSGSRTDHGESYGGVREEGLTAVLLQIPADATDLTLPNDRQALKDAGYVFAEGNRNMADLAFAPNGDLFGPDNAGDRDDPGELNWVREGEHYGFPWRIGGNDTPMQFPPYGAPYGYNDPTNDPLVPNVCNPNPADTGCYFSNDPGYPAPPEGITFVEPIPNAGPFADEFLDPETGAVRDASEEDTTITTFSGGRSPLGLVFDADSVLVDPLKGGAFVLSFAGARDENGDGQLDFPVGGQDLAFLDLDKSEDGYTLSAEAVVTDFTHPIDAVMVENVIYVIEYGSWFGGGGSRGVWAVTLPRSTDTASEQGAEVVAAHFTVYPNPTSGALTLAYRLGAPSEVRIEVFDVLGRVVRTEERRAGEGRVVVPTEGLGAGVYVARLTAGGVHETRTFTVTR
jgi:hypothetical protein